MLQRIEPANPLSKVRGKVKDVLTVLCTPVICNFAGCILKEMVDALSHVLALPRNGLIRIKLSEGVNPAAVITSSPSGVQPLYNAIDLSIYHPLGLDFDVAPDGSEIVIGPWSKIARSDADGTLGMRGSYRIPPGVGLDRSTANNMADFAAEVRPQMSDKNTVRVSKDFRSVAVSGHPLIHLEIARMFAASEEAEKRFSPNGASSDQNRSTNKR